MEIRVRIADMKVGRSPDIISTAGLGSCVAVIIYDAKNKLGGMLHFMLPDVIGPENRFNPFRFGHTGIPMLIDRLMGMGAEKEFMKAYLVGGAKMFPDLTGMIGSIGERNVSKAVKVLKEHQIKTVILAVGENYGRSVKLFTKEGKILVSSLSGDNKEHLVK